jgi:hypothetical protein
MNNEPVAWMVKNRDSGIGYVQTEEPTRTDKVANEYLPLYTHPANEYKPNQTLECSFNLAGFKPPAKTLTDEEIESWITEWAKDLYGTLYVEPTDHQRTMAIKMARAILKKASDNKRDELTREQIVLWAYEAGFPTNYARGEITRFETFARLVQKYLERDYK